MAAMAKRFLLLLLTFLWATVPLTAQEANRPAPVQGLRQGDQFRLRRQQL
jgi:hypothetical protein